MDINKLSYMGFAWTAQNLLNDDLWRAFGFKRTPKRGSFFDFLVSKRKLALERFLNKEIFALSIVDIAQAVKPIHSYIQDYCDFRVLLLTGIISNAWRSGIYTDLDDLLDTIKQVNRYTAKSDNNAISQSFVTRLTVHVDLDNKMTVVIMYGAASLLAGSNKGNGLIKINDIYREKLMEHEPKGHLSSKLNRLSVDKIAWVAIELIND